MPVFARLPTPSRTFQGGRGCARGRSSGKVRSIGACPRVESWNGGPEGGSRVPLSPGDAELPFRQGAPPHPAWGQFGQLALLSIGCCGPDSPEAGARRRLLRMQLPPSTPSTAGPPRHAPELGRPRRVKAPAAGTQLQGYAIQHACLDVRSSVQDVVCTRGTEDRGQRTVLSHLSSSSQTQN